MSEGSKHAILRRVMGQSAMMIGISLTAGILTLDRAELPADMAQKSTAIEKEIPRVSVEQVREGVVGEKIICIDARSLAEFERGHVRGAVCLPLDDLDQALSKNLDLLLQNKPIVIYCGGEGCDLSHLLARKLVAIGMDQVSVFTAGLNGWKTAGLPIEK